MDRMPATRLSRIGRVLVPAMLLLSVSIASADLKDEVVYRCLVQMGEFGAAGVRACVDGDLSAASALSQYPAEVKEIVDRCTERMERNGWAMVKLCADRDIGAAAALAGYAREHGALVERCQARVGKLGAAQVKACADREIEAPKAIERDPGEEARSR